MAVVSRAFYCVPVHPKSYKKSSRWAAWGTEGVLTVNANGRRVFLIGLVYLPHDMVDDQVRRTEIQSLFARM